YSTFALSNLRIQHLASFVSRLAPDSAPQSMPPISRATNTPAPTFPPNHDHGIKNKNFIYPYISSLPSSSTLSPTSLSTATPTPLPSLQKLSATQSTITVTLNNTGNTTAFAVPQLYLYFPSSPKVRKLRGFEKVMLTPGTSVSI